MSEEKKKSNFPFPGGRKFTGAVLLLAAAIAKCVLAGACDWPTMIIGGAGIVAFIIGEAYGDGKARTFRHSRSIDTALLNVFDEIKTAVHRIPDPPELKGFLFLPLSLVLMGLVACAPISGTHTTLTAVSASPGPVVKAVLVLPAPETAESGICTEELAIVTEMHKKCAKSLAGCDETYSIAVTGLLAESRWYRDLHPALQKLVRGSIYAGIGALIILVTATGSQ